MTNFYGDNLYAVNCTKIFAVNTQLYVESLSDFSLTTSKYLRS